MNLFDPKIFNYIIMTLYFLNAINWFYNRSLGDGFYWVSALAVTATVTFLPFNH